MKCIKNINSGVITRVADTYAETCVKSGAYVYVPKQEYKKQKQGLHIIYEGDGVFTIINNEEDNEHSK